MERRRNLLLIAGVGVLGVLQEYHRMSLHLQYTLKDSTTVRILLRSNKEVQIGKSNVLLLHNLCTEIPNYIVNV